MRNGAVVSLCDFTGNMVRPWAEAGYECWCIDLQHPMRNDNVETFASGGTIRKRWGNVRGLSPDALPRRRAITFAFPPCDHLAVSGARDFQRKGLRSFIDALELVESCRLLCEYNDAPWMLENPVSRLASSWRKPDHIIQPFEYGDPWTKATCLWTGNRFILPAKNPVPVEQVDRILQFSPGPDRKNLRSETPEGFARAVFEANRIYPFGLGVSA